MANSRSTYKKDGNAIIDATKKFIMDGGATEHTYFQEWQNDTMDITIGGVANLRLTATQTVPLLDFAFPSGKKIGFFGTAPVVRETGVAVSAAGIHAALVTLGLITA